MRRIITKICKNCVYYKETDEGNGLLKATGYCHRFPQKVGVTDDNWCGEILIVKLQEKVSK